MTASNPLEPVECFFCHMTVDGRVAVPEDREWPPPLYAGATSLGSIVAMRQFQYLLLHHACPQGNDWVATNWWACLEPTRPLDLDARFDGFCSLCAARWREEVAST